MDRADYDAKMGQMLSDGNTYQLLKKDPTASLEKKMNSRLLHLVRMGRLDSGVYSRLRSSAGRIPLLYGLPKVHKPSVPLRPIVSFVSSPTYHLSKFLADLLQPVVGRTGSHVKNSSDFVDFIKSQKLTGEETMMSFDVVSLFTCVPTDLAVRVARRRLENDSSLPERTSLSVDDIVDLLTLCLDATFLSFRGKVYKQVHGTAMGSPVSVVVANLVMEDVEERALESFHSPPRFWKRYVDDTFTSLPKSLIASFLDHLNGIEPSIKFTAEEERDGELAFLDVLLHREDDGTISTSVYRKATHTNQYLSFRSHHPTAHKVAIVRTLMTRADNLSSSGVERTEEEKRVTDALRGNDYPSGFIRKHTIPRRRREELENERPKTTLTLPYIRGLAEAIRRILDPLGVKVVFRPLRTLRQMLVRPKDPVPVDERKGVVYSIPCVECSSVYIGQTGRCLKQRVSEHRRALKNGDVQASALAEHVLKTGHAVDLSQSEVLDHHQHTTTRCMLESWYIQHNQAALNRERGTLLSHHHQSPHHIYMV